MSFIFSYPVMAVIAVLFLIAFVIVRQKRGAMSGLRNWVLRLFGVFRA